MAYSVMDSYGKYLTRVVNSDIIKHPGKIVFKTKHCFQIKININFQ